MKIYDGIRVLMILVAYMRRILLRVWYVEIIYIYIYI